MTAPARLLRNVPLRKIIVLIAAAITGGATRKVFDGHGY